jgi:hypothetical protein
MTDIALWAIDRIVCWADPSWRLRSLTARILRRLGWLTYD